MMGHRITGVVRESNIRHYGLPARATTKDAIKLPKQGIVRKETKIKEGNHAEVLQ